MAPTVSRVRTNPASKAPAGMSSLTVLATWDDLYICPAPADVSALPPPNPGINLEALALVYDETAGQNAYASESASAPSSHYLSEISTEPDLSDVLIGRLLLQTTH